VFVSEATGVSTWGLSELIVGSAVTPTRAVEVAPEMGTLVLIEVVVVGVDSGPQAASNRIDENMRARKAVRIGICCRLLAFIVLPLLGCGVGKDDRRVGACLLAER
jgi:predicted Na+-dependent transporter